MLEKMSSEWKSFRIDVLMTCKLAKSEKNSISNSFDWLDGPKTTHVYSLS